MVPMLSRPRVWIGVAAALGLIVGGWPGLVLGGTGGLVLTLVVGLTVRAISGGSVPRHVRRDLVTNVLAEDPEAVRMAFPGVSGEALFKALEEEVEQIIRGAVSISPSHQAVFAENVVRAALQRRFLEEVDPGRQRMLRVLGERLLRDWYGSASG
jgi:hypothetical protein